MCGCGSNVSNSSSGCGCDTSNTGELVFDGLSFECLNDLQEELFSVSTGDSLNNVLQTVFTQVCISLNQVAAGAEPAAKWFVAAGDPDDGLGDDGDMYLNNLNSDVSQKDSGSWGLQATIKGTTGTDGTNGTSFRYGTGTPAPSLGENGDAYIDLATAQIDIWTKAASAWSNSGLTFKGDTGANGTNGVDGTNGTNGSDGTDGLSFRQGTGVPAGGLGVDGDSYLNNDNGDLYLKTTGVWNITSNIFDPPIGFEWAFNAGKITPQSVIGIDDSAPMLFSDTTSPGRYSYGGWLGGVYTAPADADNIKFGGIFNLKVTGVDGALDNDVDVVVKKNGVSTYTFTMPVPSGTLDDVIIPFNFLSGGVFISAGEIWTLELVTANDPSYSTFVGELQEGSIFYNQQG